MLALLALVTLVLGEEPPVSTFASPSGAWQLTVTRTEKRWNGPVELVLVHDGAEAWRATRELGLREAVVSDAGQVAGYGYAGEDEVRYPRPVSPPDWPLGKLLCVFVFSPEGKPLVDEREPRGGSLYPDSSTGNPYVAGCFLQAEPARFVVRVYDEDVNRGAEEWRAYELDTGKPHSRARPRLVLGLADEITGPLDARAVPGTPLVLLNWSRSAYATAPEVREHGMLFQLVDTDWNVVWSLTRPKDLEKLSRQELYSFAGAILATGDGRFELRFIAENERVGFRVRRESELWVVSELAHEAYLAAPEPHAR
jgi:hypothetical protein